MDKQREYYLDILRILASFAVIVIHVSSQNLHAVEMGSLEWTVFKSYLLATNWAVPVFCMISGSLFLSRNISIRTMISKYVFKIVITFAGWSLFYALIFEHDNGIGTIIASFVRGYSHLWFLYMIAGLYLVTPILRKVTENEALLKYFIVLGIILFVFIPEIIQMIGILSPKSGGYLNDAFSNIDVKVVSGYALYYMLGYYIDSREIKDDLICKLLIICTLAYLIPIIAYVYCALNNRIDLAFIFSNFSVGNLIRGCAIFSLVKCSFRDENKNIKRLKIYQFIALQTFTIYLIHQFIITMLNRTVGLNTLSFNPVLSVPGIAIVVFVLSYLTAIVLNTLSIKR